VQKAVEVCDFNVPFV